MKILFPILAAIQIFGYSLDFKTVPKAELHLHLGGAYPLAYLLEIATTDQGIKLQNELMKIAEGMEYSAAFKVFTTVSEIVNTEEKVKNGIAALCTSLKEDGVHYVEIRTGIKDLGSGEQSFVETVLDAMHRSRSEFFKARLLLSLRRNSTIEAAKKTVDFALSYKDRGIIGLDISGDSTLGNIENILPELLRAKKEGLSIVLHIGESPNEKDQEMLLGTLAPARVGHGVFLSPSAEKWILENRVPLEICLTSSQAVMIRRGETHPGFRYLSLGHPVVLCSDDPLIFSVCLSEEYERASTHADLSEAELKKLAASSFDYSLEQICR